jgi:hypothetical protein
MKTDVYRKSSPEVEYATRVCAVGTQFDIGGVARTGSVQE